MTIIEFLTYLRSLEVQVFAEGDRLRLSAPEGSITPQLKAQLLERKAELLAFLQQTHGQSAHTHAPIKPVARDRFSPLSFAQHRLWFLHQLVPGNPFYNVPTAVRLSGHLNFSVLEQSFNEIVQRHEALRTTFVEVGGHPVQVIAPKRHLSLSVIDLQTLPINERETKAQLLATEEAQRPFNLTSDLLLRVKVLQLAQTEYVLLLTMHHIVSDGWSLGVLVRELGNFYTALIQGVPATLSPLPIQYADFAHWQREWLQGEVLATQLTYWRNQLKGVLPLELPCDRPRPPVQTYRGATYPIKLSGGLTEALARLSKQEGVSLFMTLLAAFQTLLYRYTSQEDIAVGSPIANRHRSELEGLIGFFVNSLVLRTDLSGKPTFRELLGRVREVALGAYAHQDLPFEKLVEELEPERDLSRNPLFQVGFALQNAPIESLELPGLTLQPMPFASGTTRFDLEFHWWERRQGLSDLWQSSSEGLSGFIAYSTDLFDRNTIVRLLGHFQTLLQGIVANPDTHLVDLPLLTLAERQQILVEWNQTQTAYNRTTCFHHFEVQVEQSPLALAVICDNEQLTYQDLNQQANQLAHYLQQLGVRPDVLVGLCVERSLLMAIGILGILKAGGAYVPLNPKYPSARLQLILADTQVPVLLTHSRLLEKLPDCQAQIVCLDDKQTWLNEHREAPHSLVTAENLAYVIYTSGSTGTPKGVLIPHQGLCNVAQAQQQVFNLQPGSRILQFSSLSFDASVFELIMALASGGTLCIPPPSARLPGTALIQFLREETITHAILPPAVLAVLPADNLPVLQTLISGGEACSQEIVERWAVGRQFFNAYGPTETSIWATLAQLTPASDKLTIGRPVANTQTYILDTQLQPLPIGAIGELYLGGDGLARGYLHRPELTAQRFIPNPFSQSQKAPPTSCSNRLYKTGDLARYHHDGSIEFLGRADDQIKIRGFRIELGEVETVLRQHTAVREAVAIAQTTLGSDKRLIAYFTLNQTVQDLRLEQLQSQQLEHWQTLYNQTYSQASSDQPTSDLIGWQSSYTRQPIPAEQMREWVSERVRQILALKPQRILEIGCGTGLLLFQLAPHCTHYWGTDFSSVSLDYIQQQLAAQQLPQVKLLHTPATDFAEIPTAAFDAVILNSVVQYFPSLDYLLRVFEKAIQAVAPGGFMFIGDVRSLPLLSAFHASVQLYQAHSTLERSQFHAQVQRSIFEEPELVIDPAFFSALRERFPQIRQVQIQLPRGRFQNELTQFRFNVLIHLKADSPNASDREGSETDCVRWLDWTQNQLTVADVRRALHEAQPELLGITGVPNARLQTAVKTAEWLVREDIPTVGRMREALENLSLQGIDPQDWWDLEGEFPYQVEVCGSSIHEDRYDVVLSRQGVQTNLSLPLNESADRSRWKTYANQPLQTQFVRQLIPQLRRHLEQKLPEYMLPVAFVALEALPLTANGKVNRRTLPQLAEGKSTAGYVAPRSPVEEMLVQIWADLLRLKQVGIHDRFFELGGHSLLATQMISRVRDAFGVEVPLQKVFEAPTIAQLADIIVTLQASQAKQQAPALVPLDRESRRRLRSSLK